MDADADRRLVERLLAEHGETFAAEAGIQLADEPGPLWQLLVLTQLLSARIASTAALASARELFAAGWVTPAALRASTWRQRVDALGRGGYRRYDFSTATRLADTAQLVQQRWHDDLRALRAEGGGDARATASLLRTFDGIGPTGAEIFLREVQAVWPELRPHLDPLALKGAAALGLPTDADRLAGLVDPDDLARLCAALVRVARRAPRARVATRERGTLSDDS